MTKVVTKRRPIHGIQLVTAADAIRFRLGDSVGVEGVPNWLIRAIRWVLVKVFRRPPALPAMLTVVAVDHKTGVVTLEARG